MIRSLQMPRNSDVDLNNENWKVTKKKQHKRKRGEKVESII